MKEYFTQFDSSHIKLLKSLIGKTLKYIFVENDNFNMKSAKESRCTQLCYFSVSEKGKTQLYEFWNEIKPTPLFGDDYTQDDFACYSIKESNLNSLDESKWRRIPINQIIKDVKIVTDSYHIKIPSENFDSQLTSDIAVIIECTDFNILFERCVTWTEVTDISIYTGAAELQLELNHQFCYDDEEDKFDEGATVDSKRTCWSLKDKKWKQVSCAKNGYKENIPMTNWEFYQLIFYALDNVYDEQTEKDEKLAECLSGMNPDIWNGVGSADSAYYAEFEKWMGEKSFENNYGFNLVKTYLQQMDPEYLPDMDKFLDYVEEDEWIEYAREFLESVHEGE